MKKSRVTGLLLVIAMLILAIAGCGSKQSEAAETAKKSDELTKITVSEFRGLGWAAVYVADAKGYYKEEGLDIDYALYDDGPVAFQGMHGGDSQFCLLSQEPVLKAQQEGLKSTIIYTVLDTRAYGFVSAPDIKDVKDLKGKTIFAGMQGSAPYSFVSAILKEAGLNPEKDVTFVNMDYSASMAALEQKQIQASYINTDNRVEIETMDVNILVDTARPDDAAKYLKSDVFPGEIICATTDYVKKNPETVQAFVNAISEATDWMNANTSEEIAKVIAPYFEGMTEDVLARKIEILKTSITKTGMIDEKPEKAVQDFCIGNGVISKQIPYKDIIDMTFVNKFQKNK